MKYPAFLRFFHRCRLYYLVNIIGMSMSLSVILIAFLFIYRELSTDRFHKNIRNIYCVQVDGRANTPLMYAELLKDQLPGFGSFTRVQLWDMKFNVLRVGSNPPLDLDKIIRADTNFFCFFSFSFISGDPGTCLEKPESLVLTRSSAVKLFGNEEPIGKQVSYNKGQMTLTVTAVVEDPPFNSSLDYNAVMSVNSLPVIYPPYNLPGPFYWSFETFVTLDGVNPGETLNKTASEIFFRSIPEDGVKEAREIFKSKFMVSFMPYGKAYFNKEFRTSLRKGNIQQVRFFSLIAFLLVLVALVNYINLSNAAATMRIKDVIIRKIMGESPGSLFWKFLLESMMISSVSVSIALILGNVLTGILNNQQLLSYPLVFFSLKEQALILFSGTILIGVAGGSIPAAKLSSLNPAASQRHVVLSGAVLMRKLLLILQFFITACLLICAIVISRQYAIMTKNPEGFNSENILYLRMGKQLKGSYLPFTDKLRSMPQVVRTANARYGFIGGRNPGLAEFTCNGNKVSFDAISFSTDTGFMEMLGLRMASGYSFREHDNIEHKLIINEAALKLMGDHSSLSEIRFPDKVHGITWDVVGVVKDFNTRSAQYPVSPYIFYFVPGDADMDGLYIKLRQGENIAAAMDIIRKTALEFSPDEPVDPRLLDDARAEIYKEDNKKRKLFLFFSAFTMLISCLGLYALSGFILGRRTKETGIRKVYGADKRSVTILLSTGLLKIVLTGYLAAMPLCWYLMNKWLQNFALKTGFSWWIFPVAAILILLIALLSVSLEIRKISSMNVTEMIRYE